MTSIRLAKDEAAIFGYGSLMWKPSVETTLGRTYDGPFVTCHLEGWHRAWDVAMPNSIFFENGIERFYPQELLYLNVRESPGAVLNGVLLVVSAEELEQFDRREWIYDRRAITSSLTDVTVHGGDAYVYVAREEHVRRNVLSRAEAAVRQTYVRIVEQALQHHGDQFRADYLQSTDPVPAHLLFTDMREPA